MKPLKDVEHLLRVALVFLLGLIAFLGIRSFFVPRSFGQYGHYRGDAISAIAALPLAYAGHETCEGCHTDVFEQKKSGKHAGVACEACHGPQARHAEDPATVKPARPDTAMLCARCHEANAAKPKSFPQVVSQEHSGGMTCGACHQAHSPSMDSGEQK